MSRILVFRKGTNAPKKLKVAEIKAITDEVNITARVNRDPLIRFMFDGSFAKLPLVKQSEIDSDAKRRTIKDKGWEVPSECLGRIGEATPSAAESIRLWVKQRLGEFGVDSDSVSVLVMD